MASIQSLGVVLMFSVMCIVVHGDMYFAKDIGDCVDKGVAVEPGVMYTPNVCTTCKCIQERVAECLRMVCGPCERDQTAEQVEGQCCPKCVPAPTQ